MLCGVRTALAAKPTKRGLALRSALMIDPSDTRWMKKADCRPDAGWTPDRKPSSDVMMDFALICLGCPVRRECAAHAIDKGLDNGIYAGVYVPTKLNEQQRRTWGFSVAMNELARIAGRSPVRKLCRGVRL